MNSLSGSLIVERTFGKQAGQVEDAKTQLLRYDRQSARQSDSDHSVLFTESTNSVELEKL